MNTPSINFFLFASRYNIFESHGETIVHKMQLQVKATKLHGGFFAYEVNTATPTNHYHTVHHHRVLSYFTCMQKFQYVQLMCYCSPILRKHYIVQQYIELLNYIPNEGYKKLVTRLQKSRMYEIVFIPSPNLFSRRRQF